MTTFNVPDSSKMLIETFCVAQTRIGESEWDADRKDEHINRLQRLIDAVEGREYLTTGPGAPITSAEEEYFRNLGGM